MKFSKISLAIAASLGATASFNVLAMDLYVDTKTKQIYAEPGRGRVLMGSFEQVGGAPAKTAAPAPVPAEIDAMKQDLEVKTNEIKALQEHAEEASAPSSVKVKLDDGIHFETKDGNFKASINGRMQVDSQSNVNQNVSSQYLPSTSAYAVDPKTGNIVNTTIGGVPAELNDGATIRRARLGLEGTFYKDTDYKFEYDFTRGNGLNAGGITDAFVRYNFSKAFSVKAGSFKEPFSLEEATSNRYITFIERNMAVNTFVDNLNTYKVGAGANYAAERWQAATSFQTEGVGGYNAYGNNSLTNSTGSAINTNGGVNRNGGGGDTGWEVNARVTGQPWMESKTKFLHVGASGSYISINNNYLADGSFSNGGIVYANGVGANVDRSSLLNTANLTTTGPLATGRRANSVSRFGVETALVYGPFSAQSEYIQTNVDGKGYNSNALNGAYAYMTYFLTGESRSYKPKTGAWDRIKPNHNFDLKGGWGAWELATGYDYMDLNSGPISGGRASTYKLGVNWYPNSHMRIMADYIHLLDINTTNAATPTGRAWNNGSLDMIETRIQFDW